MDDFAVNKNFQFGTENPTLMEKPFWKYMVCHPKLTAFCVSRDRRTRENDNGLPVYCFARFGATQTYLPDGRLICIGGEHEDSYDPDYEIYNDVVVIKNPKLVEGHYIYRVPVPRNFPQPKVINNNSLMLGTSIVNDVTIYGYPLDVFPPTDFHTATYVQNKDKKEFIYIIGGTGCIPNHARVVQEPQDILKHFERTRVYRLCLSDFSIQLVETTGHVPWGCTYGHNASLLTVEGRTFIEIRISSEKIDFCNRELSSKHDKLSRYTITNGEKHRRDGTGWGDHPRAYRLDIETGAWTVFEL